MAVYFCVFPGLPMPFATSHHVGFGCKFLIYINDPHPASGGEHYARNAQKTCERTIWRLGASSPLHPGRNVALSDGEAIS